MDKQKIIETSKIFIVDDKTGKEIEVGCVYDFADEIVDAFTEAGNKFGRLLVRLRATITLYKTLKRLRTNIASKTPNRTKKKQRLTRLQRRAKRQK